MRLNKTRQSTNLFGILSDPTRLNILRFLIGNNDVCVSDIAKTVDSSLSAVSHQLRKLEFLGIVKKCRKGKEICYQFDKENSLTQKVIRLLKMSEN